MCSCNIVVARLDSNLTRIMDTIVAFSLSCLDHSNLKLSTILKERRVEMLFYSCSTFNLKLLGVGQPRVNDSTIVSLMKSVDKKSLMHCFDIEFGFSYKSLKTE